MATQEGDEGSQGGCHGGKQRSLETKEREKYRKTQQNKGRQQEALAEKSSGAGEGDK